MLSASFQNGELRDIRATFIKFRENMKRAIFGQYQEFGIRVFVNALFVPTQLEPWGRYVAAVLTFGSPGSGKTTGAFAGSCMMRAERNVVAGLEDISPSMLIGYVESVAKLDGKIEKVFHPGALVPGRCYNILDEVSRFNPACQPPLANILADGIIRIEDMEKPCAPENKPLINVLTANLSTSGGTKNVNEFLRDRIVASAILVTPWKDKDHVRGLLTLKSHWQREKDEGILDPFMDPEDVISAHEAIMKHVECSKEMEDYQVRLLSGVISDLSHANWASYYKVPDRWKEAFRGREGATRKDFPDEPLICSVGGRVPQQLFGLACADSFLEYGSLEVVPEAVQQMLKGVLWHRLMYGLNESGYKILAKVYNNELIPFLEDTVNWIISLVPAPKLKQIK